MISSVEVRTEQRATAIATSSLNDRFDSWFDVVPADTPDLLKQVYKLRYQVYCTENQFENPQDHPDEMEVDDFDARSVHTLLIDRSNRAVAGTVRLILPEWEGPGADLPIQIITGSKQLLKGRAAEISRFAISKAFRMRSSLTFASNRPELIEERRKIMSVITLGLMQGIVRMSQEHGITDLYAVMEPALLRLLSRFAIYFQPFGPLVDYHGVRQPCHVNLESLLSRTLKERPEVWEIITEDGILLYGISNLPAQCC